MKRMIFHFWRICDFLTCFKIFAIIFYSCRFFAGSLLAKAEFGGKKLLKLGVFSELIFLRNGALRKEYLSIMKVLGDVRQSSLG